MTTDSTPDHRDDVLLPGRRAQSVRISTGEIPGDLAVDPHASEILVIVEHRGAVIGQQWLHVPGDGILRAEALTECVVSFAYYAQVRDAREVVERALGRPPREPVTRTVTVVICTRDRAAMLRDALRAVLALRREVEVLVVDNCPSDDQTAQVCRELGVRYVREDVSGLSAGRNRALRESDSDLLAFTDDDVIVSPEWLDHIDEPFDDPLVMVATGYLGPHELDHHDQVEFEAHGGFERHPERIVFSNATHTTMSAASIAGAGGNMVIRRSVAEHLGGFDAVVGPGTPSAASDDKVFFYRVIEAGYRIEYDPRRIVWHRHRSDHAVLRSTLAAYTTGEFAWTAHMLRTRHDLGAVKQWTWWGRHMAGDVRRSLRGGHRAVGLDLTASELAGIARAPRAYRALAGLGDHTLPGGLEPAPAPVPCWSHRATPVISVREAPSLTVAIASHNRRDSLKRTLLGLAAQDVPREHAEVIVVLDGCTDGSAEMVRGLDTGLDLHLIEQEQTGFSGAREAGIDAAKHPVVVMLDDDIVPLDGWLAAFGARHAALPREAWVFGNHQPAIGDGYSEQGMRAWWSDHLRRKATPGHRWTAFDCVDGNSSVTLSWFRELGGFDPELARRRQDYELGFRHLASGGSCAFAEEARAEHHLTAGVGAALRIARNEGYGDVLMAVKHPTCMHQLPLANASLLARGSGRGAAIAARIDDDRAVAVLARLEAAGQHRPWRRLMAALWADRYRGGVRERLQELGLDAAPAAPARRRIAIDLDGPGGPDVVPADIHDVTFLLRVGGRAIDAIPAIEPNSQWDWDDVVSRAAWAMVKASPLTGRIHA